jgi:hypothetical protein
MPNLYDILVLLLVTTIVVLIIAVFIRTSIRLRKGGGSTTTIALGSTDELLTKDQRQAAETIVNINAGKKLEEQRTGEE